VANYQVTQSLNALALGGVFGAGIGNSIYKLFYLPYPHTDFIFSIIGEELGFIGGICVIALFMLLIWRGIHIALHVTDRFASLLSFGITAFLGVQTIVNIGVVTGMLPTKGITLPFISYGGSSLLISLISVGILLNISRDMGE
jgi:cell division protein FtsW